MSKVPMTFRVPQKLWENFTTQTNALFLSYGPFLDHIMAIELPYLQKDLEGLKLSLRAKRHISSAFKKEAPLKPNVNFGVQRETAELLRDLSKAHNLVRDAFFCRLLVLLRGTDALLKYLEVPRYANDQGLDGGLEEMPASPLKAMESVRDDPLFYIREHVRARHGCGLYLVGLPHLVLTCHIQDDYVPGTRAHRNLKKALELL